MERIRVKAELFSNFGVHGRCLRDRKEGETIILEDMCTLYKIVIQKFVIKIYKNEEHLLDITITEKTYKTISTLYNIYRLLPFLNTLRKIVMIVVKLIK